MLVAVLFESSLKVEAPQGPTNEYMDEQNVARTYNGMLVSLKKEENPDIQHRRNLKTFY